MERTVKLISALVCVSALNACSLNTYQQQLTLDQEFASNSKAFKFKQPFSWGFNDEVFNLEFGELKVQNTYTSWQSSQTEKVTYKTEINLIGALLSDVPLVTGWEDRLTKREQKFSFDLSNQAAPNTIVASSQCFVKAYDSVEVMIKAKEKHIEERQQEPERLTTFLNCSVKIDDSIWTFDLNYGAAHPFTASLTATDSNYQIDLINHSYYDYDDKSKQSNMPAPTWESQASGLSVNNEKGVISAVSFFKDGAFWLHNSLTEQETILLTALNYNLTLFNWLDADWRNLDHAGHYLQERK